MEAGLGGNIEHEGSKEAGLEADWRMDGSRMRAQWKQAELGPEAICM
jgi:hypothetical protein